MKKYLLLFFLCGRLIATVAQPAQSPAGDSTTFFLHKFAQNIGRETYWVQKNEKSIDFDIRFRFVDRGSPVPLQARLSVTSNYEPLSFWINGNTSRFSMIHDSVVVHPASAPKPPFFTVSGYAPGTVQMALLQYWRRHGRPSIVHLLPSGTVHIRLAGADTLTTATSPLLLERFVISGLIWGNELVWTDRQGNLICLITNDAEGDKLEMMAESYENLLPRLIARAATYGMQLFSSSATPKDKQIAIVDGRLINIETGAAIDHSVILVENGKITKIGTQGAVPIPTGARIIHAEGRTVLPGLWDMHAHFEQAEWGPAYLAAGVTTVRDCGNEFAYINAVKRTIDEGHGVGPHILRAGIIDGPGPAGIGIIRASTPREGAEIVRTYKDSGFDQIKIYSSVQPEVVRAICDEAHRLGMTVTGHIPEGMTLIQGVDSGMDMVNHIQYVYSLMKRNSDRTVDFDDPQTTAALDFISSHHVVIDPTLGVFEMIFRSQKDTITKLEPAYSTLPEPLQALFVNMGMPPDRAEQFKPVFRDMEKIVKLLHDRGITIVAGTDMGFPGLSVDRELELYVEAGLTPLEALRTATIIPAQVMKQDAVTGSIESGKQADLILVEGDPLTQIRDLRKVRIVIKDGVVYQPQQLRAMAGFLK